MNWPAGLPASLIRTESGGNFRAQNQERGHGGQAGHFGRGQFGHARLQDAKRAGVIPADMTPQQFMADPGAQQRVEAWHVSDIGRQINRMGLDRFIGQNVGGQIMTPENMIAVAHLGGVGGLRRYLESGGSYNPSDSFGTSLASYARTHGNGLSMGQTGPAPYVADYPLGQPTGGGNALAGEMQPEQQEAAPDAPQNALRAFQLDPRAFMSRQMPQNAFAAPEYRPRYLTRG